MNKTIDPPPQPPAGICTKKSKTSGPISLISSAETLALLRVSGRDLVNAVNRGRLEAFDLAGHLRFRRADVLALLGDADGSEAH